VNELDRIKQGKVERKRQEETHIWDKGKATLISRESFQPKIDVSMFKCVTLSKQAWVSQRNVR
jgi:hypothetical protein